jgi:hypothetical protein
MTSDNEKDELVEHIINEIKKSGYPLEIEVSNLLDNEGFIAFNTRYYFDEELQIGRDIDIQAFPIEVDLDFASLPVSGRMDLVIECKKSTSQAWIFYTRKRLPVNSIYIGGQYHTTMLKPKEYFEDSFNNRFQNKYLALHYNKFSRIGIAFQEIKIGKIGKNEKIAKNEKSGLKEIFEATNQLVNFICYETHQIYKRLANLPKSRSVKELAMLLFPIIVFDGGMFEVVFDSEEPILTQTNHVLLETHYRCPYCGEVESYTIDVVHRSYFQQFLKDFKTNLIITNANIRKNAIELEKIILKDKERYQAEQESKL